MTTLDSPTDAFTAPLGADRLIPGGPASRGVAVEMSTGSRPTDSIVSW